MVEGVGRDDDAAEEEPPRTRRLLFGGGRPRWYFCLIPKEYKRLELIHTPPTRLAIV